MIRRTGIGSCFNTGRFLLNEFNEGNYLDFLLNSKFMIFWWILRLNKVFLVNLEYGDWLE